MRRRRLACLVLASAILAGCSQPPHRIAATEAPLSTYQAYDCRQLFNEAQRIVGTMSSLGARLESAAEKDVKIWWASFLLFWPAAFWLGGTRAEEAHYSVLKGQYEAVQKITIERKCGPEPAVTVTSNEMHGRQVHYAPVQAQPSMTSTAVPAATVASTAVLSIPPASSGATEWPRAQALARSAACHQQPAVTLAAKGPGFETYSVPCESGDIMMVRCEYGNCRAMK